MQKVRLYDALEIIEYRRGYKPGEMLFVSLRELEAVSGLKYQNIGKILERLFWHGLVTYKKGAARSRGIASEIRRVVPIPSPQEAAPVAHLDVPYEALSQNTPMSAIQHADEGGVL